MIRRRHGVPAAAAALVLSLTALAPATATSSHHRGGAGAPDVIALPDGWQPEGITTDGRYLYAGSLADGALWRADPRTGEGALLEPGVDGRVATGVDHDRRRRLLWVAGGDTGEVRAHDARTGDVLATYTFGTTTGRFVNDLVVTRRGVYATDSVNQELLVVPLRGGEHDHRPGHGHGHGHGQGDGRRPQAGSALPPASAARTLPLTGDLAYQEGFNLNGIVAAGPWLVAVQSNTGTLFRIHPRSGDTDAIDLGAGVTLTNGDGIEPGRGVLYVVRNQDELISVVDLDRRLRTGEVVDEITDDDFDVPTTAALVRHSLYAVNARFGTEPTPQTPYTIARVDARCP